VLTATCIEWHIENSKNDKKRWYYSASLWRLGDVTMANITFLSFLLFSMRQSRHGAVNTWLTAVFFTLMQCNDWYGFSMNFDNDIDLRTTKPDTLRFVGRSKLGSYSLPFVDQSSPNFCPLFTNSEHCHPNASDSASGWHCALYKHWFTYCRTWIKLWDVWPSNLERLALKERNKQTKKERNRERNNEKSTTAANQNGLRSSWLTRCHKKWTPWNV